MRHPLHLVIVSLAALASLGTAAVAHEREPAVAYGYELDPADPPGPIYVVNQGPYYAGPGIVAVETFAVPTYYERGYAYALPYPYIGPYGRGYGDWAYGPGYAPVYRSPYWHGRFHRADDAVGYGPRVYRRHVFRPYPGAYRYRPAPSARVIRVNEQPRVAPPAATPPMPQARPQTPSTPPAKPGQPDAGGHSR